MSAAEHLLNEIFSCAAAWNDRNRAEESADGLLAENERLREALREIAWPDPSDDPEAACEEFQQIARAALAAVPEERAAVVAQPKEEK